MECLEQDCSNSIANMLELLQSCTKPLICTWKTLSQIIIDNYLILNAGVRWYLDAMYWPWRVNISYEIFIFLLNPCNNTWRSFICYSIHENHRTCQTYPMARPKCLMRDFTNFNRIYNAHRTKVLLTTKVFWLHCCLCTIIHYLMLAPEWGDANIYAWRKVLL